MWEEGFILHPFMVFVAGAAVAGTIDSNELKSDYEDETQNH